MEYIDIERRDLSSADLTTSSSLSTSQAASALPDPNYPFRNKNPFIDDAPTREALVASIYDGREYMKVYAAALAMLLVLYSVVFWTVRVTERWLSYRKHQSDVALRGRAFSGFKNVSKGTEEVEQSISLVVKASPFTRLRSKLSAFLMYQPTDHIFKRKCEPWGITLILILYFAINIAFFFKGFIRSASFVAFRSGIIAGVNIPILYIFGFKYSPLSWLTGWSYEQLNVFHRFIGVLVVYAVLIHTLCFLYTFRLDFILKENFGITGLIGAASFLLIGATSADLVRRKAYEFFYAIHFIFMFLAIPAIILHVPVAAPFGITAGLAFIYDRLTRIIFCYRLNLAEAYVTEDELTVLKIPKQGARQFLYSKSGSFIFRSWVLSTIINALGLCRPLKWGVGTHVFITVIGIDTLQAHPFTVASFEKYSPSMDIIIKAQEGFSRHIYDYVSKQEGGRAKLLVLVDGPYGTSRLCLPTIPKADVRRLTNGLRYNRAKTIFSEFTSREVSLAANSVDYRDNYGEPAASALTEACELVNIPQNTYSSTEGISVASMHLMPLKTHIVLVAGGTGIAFVFPFFMQYIAYPELYSVHLIWTIKEESHLAWCEPIHRLLKGELETGEQERSATDEQSNTIDYINLCLEANRSHIHIYTTGGPTGVRPDLNALLPVCLQASQSNFDSHLSSLPDAREAGTQMSLGHPGYVAVCGPASLVQTTRNETSHLIDKYGWNIKLCCEEFTW